MQGGATFTANCLLDALQYCDLRAPTLRVQIDGCSDNVNYTTFCLAGLLVLAGIFDEVQLCRLPVG